MDILHGVVLMQISLLFSCFPTIISSNACNFDVKMKQVLHNEGFHRNLTYGIVFNAEDDQLHWLFKDCIAGIEQTLPSGVYANPDELSELRRIGRLNAVPKNRINIELPAEQSSPSSVYLIGKLIDSNVYLWMPVHARYHKAVSGGGMARNTIPAPKLFVRCPEALLTACSPVPASVTFLCNGSSDEHCHWKEINYSLMTDTVTWEVPVGNLDHFYVVAIATGATIVIGSLYLLAIILEQKMAGKKKQS